MYNLYIIEGQFKESLVAGNMSSVSVRNYLSDLRYFLGWHISIYKRDLNLEEFDDFILQEFKNYLLENNIPLKTVNRRLSTMRKFSSFLFQKGIIASPSDMMVKNIVPLNKKNTDKLPITPKINIIDEFKYDLLFMPKGDVDHKIDMDSISELIKAK